jgi:glucose-6-phosphate isomerase
MRAQTAELEEFAADVRGRFSTVFLLGMGGSSLGPEVTRSVFGARPGSPSLTVLDTTDPDEIRDAESAADLGRTFFLVSSKSGGTIESASLAEYFYEKLSRIAGSRAGASFAAITDAGTTLEQLARSRRFARVFCNPADIGGRYSALSYFGLVPMALQGGDVGALLERAAAMMERCSESVSEGENPGLVLGAILATLARRGRDKTTLVLAPQIHALGAWLEQLLAESTGKEGSGIVPVDGEQLADPDRYGSDRLFVSLTLAGVGHPEPQLGALERAGHPVVRLALADRLDLGAELFRWEMATCVAGALLGIDPFDQPNVQESKDNTRRVILRYVETGHMDEGEPALVDGDVRLFLAGPTASSPASLAAALRAHLALAAPGDYAALLAYLERSTAVDVALGRIRSGVRDRRRLATTCGYGPRFLHSTGQLHKGGPATGLFLQITAAARSDLEIPGQPYSFGTLRRAQAVGDFQALAAHGRRVLWFDLTGDVSSGLEALERLFREVV